MTLYRRYQWHYRARDFWYEISWPRYMWDKVAKLPHDVKSPGQYGYFIHNDPSAKEISLFVESVIGMVSKEFPAMKQRDKLECMLHFVQHLDYKIENGEYPRYPSETLITKGGDCEDSAILMGLICSLLGYEAAFLYFVIREYDIGNTHVTEGHMDLGVKPNYKDEFSGTYWTLNGNRYYYMSCNGKNHPIGLFLSKAEWGGHPVLYLTTDY